MKGRGLLFYTVLYLAFLYAPIALLPIFAFNSSTIIAFPLDGFTTEWFRELTTVEALHDAVGNSLFIAVVTAILSTLLGLCAARAATRYRFPGKGGIMGMIMPMASGMWNCWLSCTELHMAPIPAYRVA